MGSVKCGISSVLMPLKQWLNKDPDIAAGFNSYLKSRDLDLLLAMNAYTDPEFHRELALYTPDNNLREKTLSFLKKSDLGLKDIGHGDIMGDISFFSQGNLSRSRKKLQPLLNDFFSNL